MHICIFHNQYGGYVRFLNDGDCMSIINFLVSRLLYITQVITFRDFFYDFLFDHKKR